MNIFQTLSALNIDYVILNTTVYALDIGTINGHVDCRWINLTQMGTREILEWLGL